jgi:hypothetical protein
MPTEGEPVQPADSCEVRGWKVFGPGYHKQSLYSPQDIDRLAANFAILSTGPEPFLVPSAGLGHDKEQRLAGSLGYPNSGRIVGLRVDNDRNVSLDIVGVPIAVGQEINAGRLNAGSVELAPEAPDPRPGHEGESLKGPVLTGIAFLGEEQPAVKGFPPPRATMPGGGTNLPNTPPPEWLGSLMASAKFSDRDERVWKWRGREIPLQRILFSEMTPMPKMSENPTREELDKEMAEAGMDPAMYSKFSDEEMKKFAAGCKKFAAKFSDQPVIPAARLADPPMNPPAAGAGGAPPIPGKEPPPTPAPPPAAPMEAASGTTGAMDPNMMAAMKACMGEAMKPVMDRMAAVEKMASDMKGDPALQAAASFSEKYDAQRKADHLAKVTKVVDKACLQGLLLPRHKAKEIEYGLLQDDTKTFSEHGNKTKFQMWEETVMSGAQSKYFSEKVVDAPKKGGGSGTLTTFQQALMDSTPIRRENAPARKRLMGKAS